MVSAERFVVLRWNTWLWSNKNMVLVYDLCSNDCSSWNELSACWAGGSHLSLCIEFVEGIFFIHSSPSSDF